LAERDANSGSALWVSSSEPLALPSSASDEELESESESELLPSLRDLTP